MSRISGKNQWGGYCPSYMSWNSGRLKKGLCTEWQFHLYMSWYSHGNDIHGFGKKSNSTYIGVPFDSDFYDFGKFYEYIKQDPLFPQFVINHSLYDIDKDINGGGWVKGSVKIVREIDNIRDVLNRFPNCLDKPRQGRPIEVNGIAFKSRKDAAQYFGVSHQLISKWLKTGKNGAKEL